MLPIQIPFTADFKSEWSYASVPLAFRNGVDRTRVQYVAQHTAAHPWVGGWGGGGV